MLFDESVEAFDTYLKANRGLSENTRKAYRGDVEECLLALERLGCRNLNEVTIEDLRMWMAESSKKRRSLHDPFTGVQDVSTKRDALARVLK